MDIVRIFDGGSTPVFDPGDDPAVPVVVHEEIRSWPLHDAGGYARQTRISTALTATYSTDALFVQYAPAPNNRRLATGAIDRVDEIGGAVRMVLIAFDADAPDHGKGGSVEQWWSELAPRLRALGTFAYRTRNGARVVYRIRPVHMMCREDAADWARYYLASCAFMKRAHGINCDPLGDWTRLFRVPHGTRDAGGQPEQWPTIGDPRRLAVWDPRLEVCDHEAAATLRRKPAKPRKERPVEAPIVGSGRGVLYHLFGAHNWLVREIEPGKYVVTCPRDSEHSKRGADGSTVLWLPGPGDECGWLHCSHTSHQHHLWTVKDVLGFFSPRDVEIARRLAGVSQWKPQRKGAA